MKSKYRLLAGYLFLFFVLVSLDACRKKSESMSNQELIEELSKEKYYSQLLSYGQKQGITSGKFDRQTSGLSPVFELIEEICLGHKPDFTFTQTIQKPDSGWYRSIAIKLAEGEPFQDVLKAAQPPYPAYEHLAQHYERLSKTNQADSIRAVATSLNMYRWIWRQSRHVDRFVLANICGAYLTCQDSAGKEILRMRTIVGSPSTPTPTMDTYATHVITHPYWNVPKSIAIREMLPKIKSNVDYLSDNAIEVIDSNGEVIDPDEIDWENISNDNLPYRFRQDSGEDNSLGLLKVDIKNPLAIYLHDTNSRYLFKRSERWRSHGCVRVEKPTELANFLAGKEILSNNFLTDPGKEPTPPKWYKLNQRIPVFLAYLTADIDQNGHLVYYPNIYDRNAY